MNFIGIAVLILTVMLSALMRSTESSASNRANLQSRDLGSIVRKGSNTTYFDLLRMLLPDLETSRIEPHTGIAHRTAPFRHITEKGEAASLEGNFEITTFEDRLIMSDGKQILLLSLDLSADGANAGTPYEGESTVLAAFSVEPTIKLLDVVDIKTDRFTSFLEGQSVFRLNSQNDAFVVNSTHFNAGENYNDVTVLFLQANQFKIITSLLLLNTQGCGATINETPEFRVVPDSGRKYPSIVVRVKLKKDADTNECDRRTPGYTRYYQAVFSWNQPQLQYRGNYRQIRALDRFNRRRL